MSFEGKVELLFLGALTTYTEGVKKGFNADDLKIQITKQFTDELISLVREEFSQK
jgi:hypothetical protein